MPLSTATITSLPEEFWYHVAQQHELPLAAKKSKASAIDVLNDVADHVQGRTADEVRADLANRLAATPALLNCLRTLISVSDKRLYLDLSYRFARVPHPDDPSRSLCGCTQQGLTRHSLVFFINMIKGAQSSDASKKRSAIAAANEVSCYLLDKGLAEMLLFYSTLSAANRDLLISNLVTPGELQQQDAKLRGHGIEGELAKLVVWLGCQITPEGKATNPMGSHDPNIDAENMQVATREAGVTFSSDLVIHDQKGRPKIFVVGLIHTSDPGQFGVDKSSTVVEFRKRIDSYNSQQPTDDTKVELWGLVDGVGYSENKAGTIEKMIPALHLMLQNHSLYKAALRLHNLGMAKVTALTLNDDFYTPGAKAFMTQHYKPVGVAATAWDDESYDWLQVGQARLSQTTAL